MKEVGRFLTCCVIIIVLVGGASYFNVPSYFNMSKEDQIKQTAIMAKHVAVMANIEKFVSSTANSHPNWEKVKNGSNNDYHNIEFEISYKDHATETDDRGDTRQLLDGIKSELLREGINTHKEGINVSVSAEIETGKNEEGESTVIPMGYTLYSAGSDTEWFNCYVSKLNWEKC